MYTTYVNVGATLFVIFDRIFFRRAFEPNIFRTQWILSRNALELIGLVFILQMRKFLLWKSLIRFLYHRQHCLEIWEPTIIQLIMCLLQRLAVDEIIGAELQNLGKVFGSIVLYYYSLFRHEWFYRRYSIKAIIEFMSF